MQRAVSQSENDETELKTRGTIRYVYIRSLSGNLRLMRNEVTGVERIAKKMQTIHEGRVLAKLRHPNIVRLIDSNDKYIIMEHVMGCDLVEWVVEESFDVSLTIIKQIAFQLFQALKYLKETHVIHRDIKPDNIMIDPRTYFIKLVDFGLACFEE